VIEPAAQDGPARLSAERRSGRHRQPRQRRPIMRSAGIALIVCGLLATALGLGGWALGHDAGRGQADRRRPGRNGLAAGAAGPIGRISGPSGRSKHGQVAKPEWLVIPAIDVSTTLVRLGLTAQRTLAVPPTAAVAGWYTGSPRPGEIGSAIIIGHIDSTLGPGAFYHLRELRRGDYVYIIRANHTVAVFEVTALRSYAKAGFPRGKIYGPVPDAELRLITCGGYFDTAVGSYLRNVVAYAVLIR